MALLTRKRVLLIKEETEYGMDSSPTPAENCLDVRNLKIAGAGDLLERDLMRNTLSTLTPKLGKRWYDISFDCELKGSGTKGTAGKLGDLFEACGFSETVSAGSSVVYKPQSDTFKSVTIYAYDIPDSGENALVRKLLGVRGSLRIVAEAGQICRLEFTGKGKYADPTDDAIPTGMTYETTIPPIVESSVFTLNNVSLIAQSINLDMANTLVDEDDISGAAGIKAFLITGRKPAGTFNPEAVLVATYNFWADWIAATSRALSMVIGTTAGNKITITAPALSIDNLDEGDRNGIITRDIPFHLAQSTGDDEVQFKFE